MAYLAVVDGAKYFQFPQTERIEEGGWRPPFDISALRELRTSYYEEDDCQFGKPCYFDLTPNCPKQWENAAIVNGEIQELAPIINSPYRDMTVEIAEDPTPSEREPARIPTPSSPALATACGNDRLRTARETELEPGGPPIRALGMSQDPEYRKMPLEVTPKFFGGCCFVIPVNVTDREVPVTMKCDWVPGYATDPPRLQIDLLPVKVLFESQATDGGLEAPRIIPLGRTGDEQTEFKDTFAPYQRHVYAIPYLVPESGGPSQCACDIGVVTSDSLLVDVLRPARS